MAFSIFLWSRWKYDELPGARDDLDRPADPKRTLDGIVIALMPSTEDPRPFSGGGHSNSTPMFSRQRALPESPREAEPHPHPGTEG